MAKRINTAAGPLTPRERIWAAVRLLKKGNYAAIARKVNPRGKPPVDQHAIEVYMRQLGRGGFINRTERGKADNRFTASTFELVRDCGIEAPRLRMDGSEVTGGRLREQMWNVMRRSKGDFDYAELANLASTAEYPVSASHAQNYLGYLVLAGYLIKTRQAGPGRMARWKLLGNMNTGPKAPQVQAVRRVFDRNKGKVVWSPDGLEVADEQA